MMTDTEFEQRILTWWNANNDVKAKGVSLIRRVAIWVGDVRVNPDTPNDVTVHIVLTDSWRGPLSLTIDNVDLFVDALENGRAAMHYRHPYEDYLADIWARRKPQPNVHLWQHPDGSYQFSPRDYCDY